jgi:DNA-binding NtrC family response regulator
LTCQGQAGRNTRINLTHPVHCELPELLTNDLLLEPLHGGTVLLTDPYHLPIHQQQALLNLLADQLSLKLIINIKSFHRDLPQHLSFPLMKDARTVKVPSLRNHASDIRFAANYFLSKANLEWNKNIPGITEDCLQQMLLYPWPRAVATIERSYPPGSFPGPSQRNA